jgi:hypothetical protein
MPFSLPPSSFSNHLIHRGCEVKEHDGFMSGLKFSYIINLVFSTPSFKKKTTMVSMFVKVDKVWLNLQWIIFTFMSSNRFITKVYFIINLMIFILYHKYYYFYINLVIKAFDFSKCENYILSSAQGLWPPTRFFTRELMFPGHLHKKDFRKNDLLLTWLASRSKERSS